MLLNAQRKFVQMHKPGDESTCPVCGDELIPKNCKDKVSHWAHLPQDHDKAKRTCPHFESAWHLEMKIAALSVPGWEIEVPVTLDGNVQLLDAVNVDERRAVQFVHTLDVRLREAHKLMKLQGPYETIWVYDGEMFTSAFMRRYRYEDSYGYCRKLLKPSAAKMYAEVTGGYVHMRHGMKTKSSGANNLPEGLYCRDKNHPWGRGWPVRSCDWALAAQPDPFVVQVVEMAKSLDFSDIQSNPERVQELVAKEATRRVLKAI